MMRGRKAAFSILAAAPTNDGGKSRFAAGTTSLRLCVFASLRETNLTNVAARTALSPWPRDAYKLALMTTHSTLLLGATGMIGQAVIAQAGDRPLTILARREMEGLPEQHALLVAPPERWADIVAVERPATLISCLGTTIRQAGSEAAFRAVDHDLILSAARGARMAGTRQMIVVSSVGASAKSRNFYLKTKGETEDGLRALGFERLDILRPGLLMGDRAGPKRLGEGIAMVAAPFTDALLYGSLRRYRSIRGDAVGRAIVALVGIAQPGVRIHENDAMRRLAD